jgi:3-dehydrosphinganine reductase
MTWILPLVLVASFAGAFLCYALVYRWFKSQEFPLKGRNCYITGGSQGLGRSLALELAKRGANVVIAARRKNILEQVMMEMEQYQILSTQTFGIIAVDVTDPKSCTDAVQKASHILKGPLDYVFICAGTTKIIHLDKEVQRLECSWTWI